MKNTKEKVSYCIGFEMGKNLKTQFSDIDMDLLLGGFQDGIQDVESRIPEQEMMSILATLRQQIEMQQKQYVAQLAEKNKKDGEDFLQANKSKAGVVTLPSGLQYKVLKSGTGTTKPTLFDTVSIHYKGQFIEGQVFDSSYERKQPQVLPVNRVIPGWSEALQLMKTGDRWELVIPAYLAYGEQGFGQFIGPNTTLVFEIELLSINPQPAVQ
ncbi:MAG: FKBP-type peptidyl-prolyl cis-trans isomerase [Rhabdochlamydiaceae bacterium]|nr:FKBP-type peptidyl-prolyl cis-trans isomerase [Rhabdochlamydiaceae bacterium]